MIYNKVSSYCYNFPLSIQNSNLLFWNTILQQFPEEFFRQSGRRRDTRDLKKKERNFESLYSRGIFNAIQLVKLTTVAEDKAAARGTVS